MRTFLGYTLSLERPPLHGFNYASTTQLCHESTAFPSVFLCPYFATLNTVGEKSGLATEFLSEPRFAEKFTPQHPFRVRTVIFGRRTAIDPDLRERGRTRTTALRQTALAGLSAPLWLLRRCAD